MAPRSRRGWWFLVVNAVVVLLLLCFWAYAANLLWPGLWGALWAGVLFVYLIAAPLALRRRYQQLRRDESAG